MSKEDNKRFSETEQYDLSFAYSFHWERPEQQIREALKVLLCNKDGDNSSESGETTTTTMTNTKTKTDAETEARRVPVWKRWREDGVSAAPGLAS